MLKAVTLQQKNEKKYAVDLYNKNLAEFSVL